MRVLLADPHAEPNGSAWRAEFTVKGSRFLAEVFYASSQAQAREQLHAQKQAYADATHVVHAFVVGPGGEVCGMSDDGEPGGTAGRPVLDVLKGSGITNVLLTVTRWFGGTLLGTGGLVRAYGDAAKLVLSQCRTQELVAQSPFSFCATYAEYEAIRRQLRQLHVSSLQESYADGITASGMVWTSEADALNTLVQDATRGKSAVAFTC